MKDGVTLLIRMTKGEETMKNVSSVVLTSILATILAGCSLSPQQSVTTRQSDALPGVAVVESGPSSVVISQP